MKYLKSFIFEKLKLSKEGLIDKNNYVNNEIKNALDKISSFKNFNFIDWQERDIIKNCISNANLLLDNLNIKGQSFNIYYDNINSNIKWNDLSIIEKEQFLRENGDIILDNSKRIIIIVGELYVKTLALFKYQKDGIFVFITRSQPYYFIVPFKEVYDLFIFGDLPVKTNFYAGYNFKYKGKTYSSRDYISITDIKNKFNNKNEKV